MTAHIDTDSEPGAWAETLASPSCKIITQHRQQIGQVAVTFTMGRIQSRSARFAAGAGVTSFSPANSPAVTASQGGGLCVSAHNHEVTYGE
jgi:hypothetical protein